MKQRAIGYDIAKGVTGLVAGICAELAVGAILMQIEPAEGVKTITKVALKIGQFTGTVAAGFAAEQATYECFDAVADVVDIVKDSMKNKKKNIKDNIEEVEVVA